MKDKLNDLKLVLVYIYEYVIDGQKYSAVLKPINAANGVILEETFDGSGIMRGLLVSGGTVHIPIEGITNHFQSFWKLFVPDGRGGVKGYTPMMRNEWANRHLEMSAEKDAGMKTASTHTRGRLNDSPYSQKYPKSTYHSC